ncbi:MAG: hypothetical protein WD904_11300 [Dehalococcoidia bacterium]
MMRSRPQRLALAALSAVGLTVVVGAAVVGAILVAGDNGSDGGVIDSLSKDQRREVEAKLKDSQDSVQFTLLFPDYLPDTFDPIPLTGSPLDGRSVDLIFEREDDTTEGSERPVFIWIHEYSGPAENLSCDTVGESLDPSYSCTDLTIGGQAVVSQLQDVGPDKLSHTAHGIVEGQHVSVDVNWALETPQGKLAGLPEEKIQVAFDILSSLRHLD